MGALYLDQEIWQWWKWNKKCYLGRPTCKMFSKAICDRFDRESHFLVFLTKLRKTSTIRDYIATFEQLAIRIDRLGDEFYLECFNSDLKEATQAHV